MRSATTSLILLFAFLAISIQGSFSQTITPPTSGASTPSPSNSRTPGGPNLYGFALSDSIASNAMYYNIPGSAALIFKNGKIVDSAEYGFLSIRDQIPARNSTPFLIGGVSKMITYTAVLQLLDRGLFRLDQDINEVLPDIKITNPYYPNAIITFRHLLTHSAGIRDNWDMFKMFYTTGDPKNDLSSLIRNYFDQNNGQYYSNSNWFRIPSGVQWKYSHMGATLAAYLVEILVGMPFNEYCEQNIFAPLQMHNTHWFYSEFGTNISRVAYPHSWDTRAEKYRTHPLYGFLDYPDGGLKTSVMDFFNFISMLMQKGKYNGKTILTQTSVSLMTTLSPMMGQHDRQTFGLWSIFSKMTVLGHDGGERGWRSVVGFDPETKSGIIWFMNTWPRCECVIDLAKDIFTNWFGSDKSIQSPGLASLNANLVTKKPSVSAFPTPRIVLSPSPSLVNP